MFKKHKKKRVCVVGAKKGEKYIKTLYEMGNLEGIVEEDLAYLNKLMSKYPDISIYSCIQRTLEDTFDAYVLAPPFDIRDEIGRLLINKGRNVYIESPLAHTLTDTMNLESIIVKSGSSFMAGYPLVFHPAVRKMKNMLQNGVIGELINIQICRLSFDGFNQDEHKLWPLVESNLSLLHYLTGMVPIAIQASGSSYFNSKAFDTLNAVFEYEGSVNAYMFMSLMNTFNDHRIIATGSKGMLVIKNLHSDARLLKYDRIVKPTMQMAGNEDEPMAEEVSYKASNLLKTALEYFLEHLDSGIDICNIRHEYETVKSYEQIKENIYSGLHYRLHHILI